VAATLTRAGFAVFGLDHAGHGRSEGDRVYTPRFDAFVDDLHQLMSNVLSARPGDAAKPRFLLGHSMGGCIATLAALSLPRGLTLTGVVLSAPALMPDPKVVSPATKAVVHTLSALLPKLPVNPGLSSALVVANLEARAAYDLDPLVFHGVACARFVSEILRAMDRASAGAPQFALPLLVIHSEGDRLVLPEGSRVFHAAAASRDKTLKMYGGGMAHELFNEAGRAGPIADVLEWLMNRSAHL
jgi:alpha-beta hydrolase superfamily lysophospholipase